MEPKQKLLEELLGEDASRCSKFDIDWILRKSVAEADVRENHCFLMQIGLTNKNIAGEASLLAKNPDEIRKSYCTLQELGIKNNKIATHPYLLGYNPETIKERYNALKKLGLTDQKIISCANILGRDLCTIKANYKALKKLGLTDGKIASQAQLLWRDSRSIRANYKTLKKIGLKDKRIATNPHLLGFDSKTIKANHKVLKKLGLTDPKIASQPALLGRNPCTIKANYELLSRYISPEHIQMYVQLLNAKPQTIEDNIAFMTLVGIDYRAVPITLGTTVSRKKEKLRTFFRVVFDEEIPESDEKSLEDKVTQRAREFYSAHNDNTTVYKTLFRSIAYIERNKDKLRAVYRPAA